MRSYDIFVAKIYDYVLIDSFWGFPGFIDSLTSYATLGQPNIYSCRLKGNQWYGVTFKRGSVDWILRFCPFWFSMSPATSQVCLASSWQASFQARLGDPFFQTSFIHLFTITSFKPLGLFPSNSFPPQHDKHNQQIPPQHSQQFLFLLSTISTGLNALAAIALRLELFWQKGKKYFQRYFQMYLKYLWKHI